MRHSGNWVPDRYDRQGSPLRWCAVLGLIASLTLAPTAQAFPPLLDHLLRPLQRHGVEPESCVDPAIETLAQNVDWLEHELDRWGTVVPKTPDIWGEARLTKYRREVEEQLSQQIDQFDFSRLSGSQSVTDTAFLAAAISLDAQPTLGASIDRVDAPCADVNVANVNSRGEPVTIITIEDEEPRPIFGKSGQVNVQGTFGVEQVAQLDQLKRYLDHLNELRRSTRAMTAPTRPGTR